MDDTRAENRTSDINSGLSCCSWRRLIDRVLSNSESRLKLSPAVGLAATALVITKPLIWKPTAGLPGLFQGTGIVGFPQSSTLPLKYLTSPLRRTRRRPPVFNIIKPRLSSAFLASNTSVKGNLEAT